MTEHKPGFINSGMEVDGVLQPDGFDINPIRIEPYLFNFKWNPFTKTIYQFKLLDPPFTFIHPDSRWIQPGKVFETDQGTVPKIFQPIIPKDRFLGFYPHDFACRYGYLWVSKDNGTTWNKEYIKRWEADALLEIMVQYDPVPGWWITRKIIKTGVNIGTICQTEKVKIESVEITNRKAGK